MANHTPRATVVLVEDDPSITFGLRMNLEAEGFKVIVADDGETGLAAARAPGVDLLILDVMLPRLNGFEVLRQLRSDARTAPTGRMAGATPLRSRRGSWWNINRRLESSVLCK